MVGRPDLSQDGGLVVVRAPASAIAAAAALLSACTWATLDTLAPAPAGVDGGAPAASVDGAGAEDGASPSATDPCAAGIAPAREWSFDSTLEGWSVETDTGVPATVAWTGASGNPSPGALQADVTPAATDSGTVTGAWVSYVPSSPIDLSNRTISAWVWLESGESPHLKTFVQTGAQYNWADNGTVHLFWHEWACVSMPVSTPSYTQPNYDPTRAIRLGFEMLGLTPFRLYIDSVRYY
jgi:hypothetical protein